MNSDDVPADESLRISYDEPGFPGRERAGRSGKEPAP